MEAIRLFREELPTLLLATRSQAFEEGRAEERKRVMEILQKERDTWAQESIGDKALQSLLTALTPTK